MDIGVSLVESYLRLNGYLTMSEFEVQKRGPDGRFKTITDVDIMAMRTPGKIFVGDPHLPDDCDVLLINDPVLDLADDTIDVIIGEVKQGPAEFNAGIRDHAVLHSMLRRVEWLYATSVEAVVPELQSEMVSTVAARGGGFIRTRLVAFGRSPHCNVNVISLSHMVTTMLGFFEKHEDAFRPVQFRDPAPAFLRLLLKAGFDIAKSPDDP